MVHFNNLSILDSNEEKITNNFYNYNDYFDYDHDHYNYYYDYNFDNEE